VLLVDPPAPQPLRPGETPPAQSLPDQLAPGGQATTWVFNPEYQKLVDLWHKALPLLEDLTTSLDRPLRLSRSKDVWDAAVGDRRAHDIAQWRGQLATYRHAVLTAISDEAADTPRWVPSGSDAPHAFLY
jgi:hypothetical protein